mmetsp:Transcript_45543/g.142909  ORF Transcript_45543/g.142909 Transcript_45543/m.142909 type:complete len:390 (-) Transcript_45543:85-1254(-)
MVLLLWACLVSVAPFVAALLPHQDYTFEDFVADFGKSYAGPQERAARQRTFEERLRAVQAHNADPSHTWLRGINHFSDLSEAEFARSGRVGLHRTLARQAASAAAAAGAQVGEPDGVQGSGGSAQLPASVDWRAKSVVSSVKDQGSCGSCWAFATTETVESHAALASGLLPVLSPQQLVDCAPNPLSCGGTGGCQGSIPEVAYNYVQLYGLTTEWIMPYTSHAGSAGTCHWNASTTPSLVTISGYKKLPPNDYHAVMDALANVGPLAVNVQATTWSDYESGVFDGCSNRSNIAIDHVVQLVGYGTDPKGGDYWLVRNSWDVTWGEAGYIRLKRSASPECGDDIVPLDGTGCSGGEPKQHVCGTCGVLFDVSYPLGVSVQRGHRHGTIVV